MQLVNDFLTINEYSRSGKPLKEVKGIVIHWTANENANAKQNRNYFEQRKNGKNGYGSAHYIIDQTGYVLCAIPSDEVAFHCGTSQKDPVSGKVYTDEARKRFGKYASETSSPNNCTIGIELCPIDKDGTFSELTIYSAIELCAMLCKKYKLKASDITTHKDVVGWKDCPLLWTAKPQLKQAFIQSVEYELNKGN